MMSKPPYALASDVRRNFVDRDELNKREIQALLPRNVERQMHKEITRREKAAAQM